jgi:hypothetical protein
MSPTVPNRPHNGEQGRVCAWATPSGPASRSASEKRTAEDGSARQVVEVVAEELGPSLRWATATPSR